MIGRKNFLYLQSYKGFHHIHKDNPSAWRNCYHLLGYQEQYLKNNEINTSVHLFKAKQSVTFMWRLWKVFWRTVNVPREVRFLLPAAQKGNTRTDPAAAAKNRWLFKDGGRRERRPGGLPAATSGDKSGSPLWRRTQQAAAYTGKLESPKTRELRREPLVKNYWWTVHSHTRHISKNYKFFKKTVHHMDNWSALVLVLSFTMILTMKCVTFCQKTM